MTVSDTRASRQAEAGQGGVEVIPESPEEKASRQREAIEHASRVLRVTRGQARSLRRAAR